MMLDKHDVVHGLLDGEGGRGLGLGLQVAGGAHDLGQAVVQAVQVALEVALGLLLLLGGNLFFLILILA